MARTVRVVSTAWLRWALALAACLAVLGSQATPLSSPNRVLSVLYEFDAPVVDSRETIGGIRIAGCDVLNRPGVVPLPFRTARILLPPGYTVETIESETDGAAEEWPAPAGSARRLHSPDRVELLSVQRMAGWNMAIVRLFPIHYASGGNTLLFRSKLRVHLRLKPLNAIPSPASSARARVKSFVDNPAGVDEYPAAGNPEAKPGYLIITSASLSGSFEPLLERKAHEGLSVHLATLEDIVAGQMGRDDPERIRNYIRSACTNGGVEYVLLGGDATVLPCRYAYVPMNERRSECRLPCDLYYGCLDGSWNRDGDDRWGEPTDGEEGGDVDLLADVWVGRAPVGTAAEAANFVEKTIRYEERGHGTPDSVLIAAEYLGHYSPDLYAQGGRMFDPLLPHLDGLAVSWLDDRPHRQPQWTGEDALRALNLSPHIVFYNGHAQSDAMMRMKVGMLAALTNADPFLVCSVGCHAGRFDNDAWSPDSIVEELVKQPAHGAFAAVCNARLGWFDPREEWRYSGEFQLRLVSRLLRGPAARLGPAIQTAKHDLLGHVENRGTMPYRWCYYEITLLGDPHAAVRRSRKENR